MIGDDRSAFAGSIATTDQLLRVCVQDAGILLPSAVKMLTENPARILGIHAGVIDTGARPDFVVLDDSLQVTGVSRGTGNPSPTIKIVCIFIRLETTPSLRLSEF